MAICLLNQGYSFSAKIIPLPAMRGCFKTKRVEKTTYIPIINWARLRDNYFKRYLLASFCRSVSRNKIDCYFAKRYYLSMKQLRSLFVSNFERTLILHKTFDLYRKPSQGAMCWFLDTSRRKSSCFFCNVECLNVE